MALFHIKPLARGWYLKEWAAADSGSTVAQMQDFFGWQSANMAAKYISTSKPAISNMAVALAPEGKVEDSVTVAAAQLDSSLDETSDNLPSTNGLELKSGSSSNVLQNVTTANNVFVIYGSFNGHIN